MNRCVYCGENNAGKIYLIFLGKKTRSGHYRVCKTPQPNFVCDSCLSKLRQTFKKKFHVIFFVFILLVSLMVFLCVFFPSNRGLAGLMILSGMVAVYFFIMSYIAYYRAHDYRLSRYLILKKNKSGYLDSGYDVFFHEKQLALLQNQKYTRIKIELVDGKQAGTDGA